jgi:Protein of unknown function (DUF4235)
MSGKRGDVLLRTVPPMAGGLAWLGTRKVLAVAWKRITGKEPPEHPEDPRVALGEALLWTLLLGAVGHTVRILVTRATSGRTSAADEPAEATPAGTAAD